jgi:hypothetical protein
MKVAKPSDGVMVTLLQTSVAVADPGVSTVVGLQPKSVPDGHDVNTGGVVSEIQVKVCVQVDVLLQPSCAV